jgi:hypothetical protein
MSENVFHASEMENGTPEQQAILHLARAFAVVASGMPAGVVLNSLASVIARYLCEESDETMEIIIAMIREATAAQKPVMQ